MARAVRLDEVGLPRVRVVLRKLLLTLRHDIRVLIKDDESRRATSWLSLQNHASGGPWRT